MRTLCVALALASFVPSAVAAQAVALPAVEQQIAVAVLPLPPAMRAGATVLGYRTAGALVELRRGTNGMICLADNPAEERFQVVCHHKSLEPFMKRGRDLRAQGVTGGDVDSVRFREIRSGTLPMPSAAALYSLTGGTWDPATNEVTGARPLYVVYLPGATPETTGVPAAPRGGAPWLMLPGTPKAHLMFTPQM